MRRMNKEGAAIVRGRAAMVLVGVLMMLLFVMLDNMPDFAVLFLIAGVVITGIALFALKRQIENEMSHIQEAKRAERTLAERTRAEYTRNPKLEAPAAIIVHGIELPAMATLEIEELAAEILTIEDLAAEAPCGEEGDKTYIYKPYVAPSYDLFD